MLDRHTDNTMHNIHPGGLLKNILDEKGISQKEFSEIIGKACPVINDIIKGKRDINPELAILFEAALKDIPAIEWLSMQNNYDLERLNNETKIQEKKTAIQEWNSFNTIVNIKYLKKRLSLGKDIEENIPKLLSYLNVTTFEEFKHKTDEVTSYFSKSDKLHTDTMNLMTWITVVRHNSNEIKLSTVFNKENTSQLVKELNSIFYENSDTISRIERTLNRYGIKFVLEHKLEKVPVNGYSFWSGDNPTIAVTQRINRLDNFAFVLLHELGHILLHLTEDRNKDFLDTDVRLTEKFEKQANDFASQKLFEDRDYKEIFKEWDSPYNSAHFITTIAEKLGINRSIVTGQYQHYCDEMQLCTNAYSICRDYLEKVK